MNDLRFPVGPESLPAYRTSWAATVQLRDEPARREARLAVQRARRQVVSDFSQASLLRALNEGVGIPESLVWFWFNHFNVFWQKDLVGAALPGYVEEAIRPHVQGRFRDLLLATMIHPAMLVYLDNARNVAGKINENYARELLELHTLGVDGGYSQTDVQEAARLLTGFGLRPLREIRWPAKFAAQVRERGEFLFDPRRHDFGSKRVLGQTIAGQGFAEAEALADLLARHPATARHLAGKLCLFLAGEGAPQGLVDRAAQVYIESEGDLGKVVASIRQAIGAGGAGGARTFKDPHRWLTSAVNLLAAGRPVKDAQPIERWLTALGQPLFGCRTPDGYSLRGSDWVSAGQVTQRFELAGEIVRALPRLVDGALPVSELLASPAVRQLEASLTGRAREAVGRSEGQDRLALLLSSPTFMYW